MKSENKKMIQGFLLAILCSIQLWIIYQLIFQINYFYLDNPTILFKANWSFTDCLKYKSIRMEFLYNIIHVLAAKIFGNYPVTHYMIQYCFYLANIFLVFILIKHFGKKCCGNILIIFFVTLGTTVAENIFTIGKREVFLTTGLLFTFIVLYQLLFKLNNRKSSFIYFVSWVFGLLYCVMIKETGIVIIIFYFLMLLYAAFLKKKNKRVLLLSLIGLLIAAAVILLYRFFFVIEDGTYYTSVSFNFVTIIKNIFYYFKYQLDIIILGILGLVSGFISFIKDRYNEKKAFLLAVNLTGWAYLSGMCMWRWALSYYLYPALILFSISVIGINISMANFSVDVKRAAIIFSFILLLWSGINNWNVATSHIDISKVYSDSVEKIHSIAQTGDRILLENYTCYDEPAHQTNLLLNTYLKDDVSVIGMNQYITGTDPDFNTLSITGITEALYKKYKEEAHPKENDYVILYINDRNFYGPVRAVNPTFDTALNSSLEDRGYVLELIDAQSIDRPTLGYENNKLQKKTMKSGYRIYKVKRVGIDITGYWVDGWIEKKLEIKNYNSSMNMKALIKQVGNGLSENTITIWRNGEKISVRKVKPGDEVILNDFLNDATPVNCNIVIEVENTFIPSSVGIDDNRELGINLIFK